MNAHPLSRLLRHNEEELRLLRLKLDQSIAHYTTSSLVGYLFHGLKIVLGSLFLKRSPPTGKTLIFTLSQLLKDNSERYINKSDYPEGHDVLLRRDMHLCLEETIQIVLQLFTTLLPPSLFLERGQNCLEKMSNSLF